MPIVHFHLVEGAHEPERVGALLRRASHRYAEILDSPLQRVRAFAVTYSPGYAAVAGEPAAAPYFEFLVLAGRPKEQRHALLAAFTDLIVEELGVDRGLVRGRVVQLDPDDWAIGGVPASAARASEIAARAAAS
jgi:phenylpyruvate tautomerase PptA (4-oxalocrotonate tautomerase family)